MSEMTIEKYRSTMAELAKAEAVVNAVEEKRRRQAEELFGVLFDVHRGDFFSYGGRADILVVGFDWKPSLAELDYDTPRPPTIIVATRRLDGEWSKTLTKHVIGLKKMEKKGTDVAAAERLRLRA
jgi:hypothetical protein